MKTIVSLDEFKTLWRNGCRNFYKLDMKRVCFEGINLSDVCFTECDLSHTQFSEVKLDATHFSNCDMTGAQFVDCNASFCIYSNCQMMYSFFCRTNLAFALLDTSELKSSLFTRCNFTNNNINENTLKGIRLKGCLGNGTTIKSAVLGEYTINWTKHYVSIGCQQKTREEWEKASDVYLSMLDNSVNVLAYKEKYGDIIRQLVKF